MSKIPASGASRTADDRPLHPLADVHLRPGVHNSQATDSGLATGAGKKKAGRPIPTLHGSFPPPRGTLRLGIGRQPNHFTCGAETFLGITEFLRLPHRKPDMGLWRYRIELHTSYKTGTEPEDLARGAREHLGVEGRIEHNLSIDDLARLTNGTQRYADALNRGEEPTRPLTLAMVTYQAYVDPTREFSEIIENGKTRRLPIRGGDGSVLWENDWSDGHWSLVARVVQRREVTVLKSILKGARGRLQWEDIAGGLVILGDPSNGEGLSFIPTAEFDRRWHDTNRYNEPVFRHAAVVLSVPAPLLERMQAEARFHGLPMFSTVEKNSVIYLP